jgi:Fur family ferric uptake transcriptional regulator
VAAVDDPRLALRGKGLRATPSRLAVLSLLRSAGAPMSHGDVADRLAPATWDRATIYRNLTDLAVHGLARRLDVGDHVWRFEAVNDDHDATAHPHFICTECGTIECLPAVALDLRDVRRTRTPRALKQRQVEIQLRGVCDACR